MYDEIKDRLIRKIGALPSLQIERRVEGVGNGEEEAVFSDHVHLLLRDQLSHLQDEEDETDNTTTRSGVRKFGGFASRRQLEKHFFERLVADIHRPAKTLNLTITSGSRILGLPYDLEWATGNGFSFFGRYDGKALTIPKPNGFSAAGLGFYITTNTPVLAAITPQGTYNWNWTSFADLPFIRSSGGMGITIYSNAAQQPLLSRQPVLWNVSGATQFSGRKGSGRIADASSPAFGLGTLPLAPALLHMVPGNRYLVWVWCWQISRLKDNDPFIAFLQFSMPFVSIEAGPPIVIR